jgi:hypothetical protein
MYIAIKTFGESVFPASTTGKLKQVIRRIFRGTANCKASLLKNRLSALPQKDQRMHKKPSKLFQQQAVLFADAGNNVIYCFGRWLVSCLRD